MDFTAKDLVSIIKSIEGTGITELQYNGLIIRCEDPERVTSPVKYDSDDSSKEYLSHPKPDHRNPDDIEQVIQEEINNDPILQDLERMNLMIEDPKEFENMMDREDIDDAENDKRIEQSVSTLRDRLNHASSGAKNERLA